MAKLIFDIVNLNANVEVLFTPEGVKQFAHHYQGLPSGVRPCLVSSRKWRGMLWELVNILGQSEKLEIGSRPLIEENMIRVFHDVLCACDRCSTPAKCNECGADITLQNLATGQPHCANGHPYK